MIDISAYISLIVQFIIGGIDIFCLTINIPKDKNLFKDLLKLELGVQSIEFIFYLWMVLNINKISNITPFRYYDWMLTTPSMLITLTAYLDTKNYTSLFDYLKNNYKTLIPILLANASMLIFGLLGELKIMNYLLAIVLGWIPFIWYYRDIYNKFIKNNKKTTSDRKGLYWFFLSIWSLYGVAAFLPYIQKNTMYNILDLFSKNLLGLILVYIIWKNRIKTK